MTYLYFSTSRYSIFNALWEFVSFPFMLALIDSKECIMFMSWPHVMQNPFPKLQVSDICSRVKSWIFLFWNKSISSIKRKYSNQVLKSKNCSRYSTWVQIFRYSPLQIICIIRFATTRPSVEHYRLTHKYCRSPSTFVFHINLTGDLITSVIVF